jgi:CTP:molybdopterin cytidylyltransferase MocA
VNRASIAGVILAAGASSRMGQPKALLEYKGETFLHRLAGMLDEVCGRVVVVLGYDEERVRAAVPEGAETTVNPAPERGMLSSLQCGLRAVAARGGKMGDRLLRGRMVAQPTSVSLSPFCPQPTSVSLSPFCLILPVDYGAVRSDTVAAIVAQAGTAEIVVPVFEGRHGHPVCVSRAIMEELLALPAEAQAREVIRRHRADTRYITVDDLGVVSDVDTPEDYRALLEAGR